MKQTFYLILITLFCGCSKSSTTEKYQSKRDNIINVHDKIKEIVIDDVLIGDHSKPSLINGYLFIHDIKSVVEQIHIFDKNSFKYLTSTAMKGQGPGEIANMGHIAEDKTNRKFYVNDHSKYRIFSYDLDSVLADPSYMPVEKMKMDEHIFPDKYIYVNDTLCYGRVIMPIGNNDFKPMVGKWNMKTGEIQLMKYEHPDIKKRRIIAVVSPDHGMYVECYWRHDLITICNLEGELLYNIYGPKWESERSKNEYYGDVEICDDKIITVYLGDIGFTKEGKSICGTKLMIFDLQGNYVKTLETGYQITKFCFDEEKNRLIMTFNDDIQFGYLDLDGLVE